MSGHGESHGHDHGSEKMSRREFMETLSLGVIPLLYEMTSPTKLFKKMVEIGSMLSGFLTSFIKPSGGGGHSASSDHHGGDHGHH